MGEAIIRSPGLTKRFGRFTAVDGVPFDIRRGEVYGFLGLNGAGKTTTIRMLLGMIRPNAGEAFLFGVKVQPGEHDIWRRTGYMVEMPHAYPDLTVRENLDVIRTLRGLGKKTVPEIMEKLRLEQYADKKAGSLSLGNVQRLGLAKALIHNPELLILDEPANALDPAGIVEVRNMLTGLAREEGTTVFISSHILSEVSRMATRIGIIHRGKAVQELTAAQLTVQEEPRLTVEAGDPAAAAAALESAGIRQITIENRTLSIRDNAAIQHPERVATVLVQSGNPPTRLLTERKDLESCFLDIVGQGDEKR
jgi:ABC-2 type transport system ATP-binding protein